MIKKSDISRKYKLKAEYAYWLIKRLLFHKLSNQHYKYFFTDYFGINKNQYTNKNILDIGCGPRGSLEWADMANERIGLDPLSNKYKKLGILYHKMKYIDGVAEHIPFESEYFDYVTSFNSFDHFDDIDKAVKEIYRVLKRGGLFLLITDIHNYPKICEPQCISWNITNKLGEFFKIIEEKRIKGKRMYKSIRKYKLCDNDNLPPTGILTLKMKKK